MGGRSRGIDTKLTWAPYVAEVLNPSIFETVEAPVSIFSTISQLARKYQAINLGQGFPDFAPDEELTDRLAHHVKQSSNQYAPPAGLPRLLSQIAAKIQHSHDVRIDSATELNITSGATQAIWTAIQSLIQLGDEVVIFEPAYDSYAPAVESKGGVVVPCVLPAPNFRPDWKCFSESITDKTRLVILNNPHNPTGTCWTHEDLLELECRLEGTEIAVLSDEVYEHLTYDGREHRSALRYPGLRERAFVTCSFGKTFHVTGWKVGYVVAPSALMQRFRSVHQFTVFTVNTPAQHAIADHLINPDTYLSLPDYFQEKRDLLYKSLRSEDPRASNGTVAKTPLRLLPSEGSYFGLADYSAISQETDLNFAKRLIMDYGVAVIPITPFYSTPPAGQTLIRLCFAKKPETLEAATIRLQKLKVN